MKLSFRRSTDTTVYFTFSQSRTQQIEKKSHNVFRLDHKPTKNRQREKKILDDPLNPSLVPIRIG